MVLQSMHGLDLTVQDGSISVLSRRKVEEAKEGTQAALSKDSLKLPHDTLLFTHWSGLRHVFISGCNQITLKMWLFLS